MVFITKRCVVYGRVQGVFYRAFTQQEAQRLGVVGWVKNRQDGCVEVVMSGDEKILQEMIVGLWRGSASAEVVKIDIEDISSLAFSRFDIH